MQETRVTKLSSLDKKLGSAPGASCLVEIYGPDLGKKFPLLGEEVLIGRDPDNTIVVELDNVSRKHARVLSREGQASVLDLDSTNGTFVNDREVRKETQLRSGDLVRVGGAIFKFLDGGDVEAQYHEEIYRMTIMDGLTQISNKRYFCEFLEREMARCHRYGRSLSLLMFDIDHFKRVNDEHGHLAGDHVLRELAALLKVLIRKEQCLARYGGEEFAAVLPECGPDKARQFAAKVLKLVEDHAFLYEGDRLPVTVSIGVADMTPEMTDASQFIREADDNLYRAKREGRNRVVG